MTGAILTAFLSAMLAWPTAAQDDGVPPVAIVPVDLDPFAETRAKCLASLPYETMTVRLQDNGYSSTPNHGWTLASNGKLTYTDFEVDEGNTPRQITLELSCFTVAELQALASNLVEPSPEKQECAIFSDHAVFGEITLLRNGSQRRWSFSLGCTDLKNPGFNAAIKAMDGRIGEIIETSTRGE